MKKLGRPWEIGKAFERSAPCGPIYPASMIGYLGAGRLVLTVNGETRQEGDLNQMISYPSQYFELASGDIIQSGTPAGVGPIAKGDVMVVTIDGLGSFSVTVE
jgi:fumarylpyruvate hydrolase